MEARCILFSAAGGVATSRCYVPGPGAAEVLVETMLSGISPGTELRVLAGQQADLGKEAYPLIPGYALLGRVIGRGAAVPAELDGAVVLCGGTARSNFRHGWGGHISHAVLPAASVIPVAASISAADAVLCPMAAIALRGVRLAQPQPGETVAVLGLGMLGQLSARLFAGAGAKVVAGGVYPKQVDHALRAGIRAVVVERESVRRLRQLVPAGADIVVDATGRPSALKLAVSLAAEKSWDSDNLGGARLLIQGSYVGELAFPHHEAFQRELTVLWPRFSTRSDIVKALEMVANHEVRFDDLLTEVVDPESANEIYGRLRAGQGGLITAAFRWRAPATDPADGVLPRAETAAKSSPSLLQRMFGRKP